MYSVAATADVGLVRHWCDIVTKKRKEAQKEIPITNFFKK
jgi:hypothetical protein